VNNLDALIKLKIFIVNFFACCKKVDVHFGFLSRYLNQNKAEYYRLLQQVRDSNGQADSWEPWLLFMLKALQVTSQETLKTIKGLIELMQKYKR